MAVNLKSLAKDTFIYGASSIIGRFLNYMLVPLYTAAMPASTGGYGVITNGYAYTALILVLLTFGMETTLFRFANKHTEREKEVYSMSLMLVTTLSLVFLALVVLFQKPIAGTMGEIYSRNPQYVVTIAVIVALDAIQAVAFSWLRLKKRPIKFVTLKLTFIFLNIGLNLLWFVVLKDMYGKPGNEWVGKFFNPEGMERYAFYINLFCTGFVTFLFYKEFMQFRPCFDKGLFKEMLVYSWPLVVLGLAGMLNQSADKIVYLRIKPGLTGQVELGIYGAVVKIAMIMVLITQAFRYAYEPIMFSKEKDKNNKEYYAAAMKYFIIFTLAAFLAVVAWQDVIKILFIRNSDYWAGMPVVPIVMAAEIMMGVAWNLSVWYKLSDRTIWGALCSLAGCIVLFAINFLFVPRYGYMACAWGGFAGYAVTMLLSYILGQRFYPIDYPLKSIGFYTLLAALMFVPCQFVHFGSIAADTAWRSVWVIVYLAVVVKKENFIEPVMKRLNRHSNK